MTYALFISIAINIAALLLLAYVAAAVRWSGGAAELRAYYKRNGGR